MKTLTNNLQQDEHRTQQNRIKPKEKKSWELEPEEKARIQRAMEQIAEKHREQELQQKEVPLQLEESQNSQNIVQPM